MIQLSPVSSIPPVLHIYIHSSPMPASYTLGTGLFLGVKWPGHGIYHPPHLAVKLKKEYKYTSAPPLYLHGIL